MWWSVTSPCPTATRFDDVRLCLSAQLHPCRRYYSNGGGRGRKVGPTNNQSGTSFRNGAPLALRELKKCSVDPAMEQPADFAVRNDRFCVHWNGVLMLLRAM